MCADEVLGRCDTLPIGAPHRRVSSASECCPKELVDQDYEIILVNDEPPDYSLELAAQLTECDRNVVVVYLSRNIVHYKSMIPVNQQRRPSHGLG